MAVYPWTPAYNSPRMLRALKPPYQRGGGVVLRRRYQQQRGEGIGRFQPLLQRKSRPRMSRRYKKRRRW